MKGKLRVAAAQVRGAWLDPDRTSRICVDTIADAAAQGIDLVAFPETFLSGYPFWISRTDGARFNDPGQKRAYAAYLEAAVTLDDPYLGRVVEAAAKHRVFTYLGVTERGGEAARGTVFCTLVAISPDRGIVSAHRKLVPTYDERMVWGRGDGHGLRIHSVHGVRIGGLNCWENWMPEARLALYAGGEDLHVSVWPGSSELTQDIARFIALEGRVWSLAASGILGVADVPSDFPLAELLATDSDSTPFNGGSGIVSPTGDWVAGPVTDTEALVVADIDLDAVGEERLNADPTGHYSRPDVLTLQVDRRRHKPVTFLDDG